MEDKPSGRNSYDKSGYDNECYFENLGWRGKQYICPPGPSRSKRRNRGNRCNWGWINWFSSI